MMKEHLFKKRQMALLAAFLFSWNFWGLYINRFPQTGVVVPDSENSRTRSGCTSVLGYPARPSVSGSAACLHSLELGHLAPVNRKSAYTSLVVETFGWKMVGDWSVPELQVIYDTGTDILGYADVVTGGRGLEWMHVYFAGLILHHFDDFERGNAFPNTGIPFLPRAGFIFLGPGWEDPNGWEPHQLLAHELAHIWECRSGGFIFFGCAGGQAGRLMADVGIKPDWLGFLDPVDIPLQYRWSQRANIGYGNQSAVEYIAEVFSWNIYDPAYLPQFELGLWVDAAIAAQASRFP